VFDWDKIMNTGGIVYVGLDSLSDAEVAAAVGNAMFADLTSTAGRRYKFGTAFGQSQGLDVKDSKKVAIHADEFNELIGDEFVPLLNKAGGAGYQVTVYTQTWSDVEAKIGNRAKAAQIGGNLNSLIMLRVKTTDTAEILTEQLPEVEVSKIASDSRTTDVQNPDDFADFGSSSGDVVRSYKVPMLRPSDLTSLPKGQAFALLDGGQLAKVRLPLAVESVDDVHWPESLFKVFDGMHEQYSRYIKSVDEGQTTPLPIDFLGNTSDGLTVEGKGHGF
jgi:conjugal transfer pilus assembly protein TraD